jgi:hypothetical protein
MPGFLLHLGATVFCAHAGQAQPMVTNPSVTVNGKPTVTLAAPYTIVGCAQPPLFLGSGPCVTAQFVSAATRLTSNGQPLLLQDSQAICVPTATPLFVTVVQTRVTGI